MTKQEAVARLLAAMSALEGVAEEPPGSNCGTMVERFLKSVGLKKGNPWCAAVVYDAGKRALLDFRTRKSLWPLPATGGCAYLGDYAKRKGVLVDTPEVGDVFLIWYDSKKRFAHTGVIVDILADGTCVTLEGNTNSAGSREGWGLFMKTRKFGPKDRFIRWTNLLPTAEAEKEAA